MLEIIPDRYDKLMKKLLALLFLFCAASAVRGAPPGPPPNTPPPAAGNALYLATDHSIPLYQALSFGSVSAVENYMGVGNHLVSAANTFFASAPPGSDFLVANAPVGGHRAHIFGANNFDTLTLAQIQEIRGTLSFTTQGYAWGRVSVNLSSVSDSTSSGVKGRRDGPRNVRMNLFALMRRIAWVAERCALPGASPGVV